LKKFRAGKISAERALRAFQAAPVADLGFARVDTHRALRKGFPEVIYAAGKTAPQVVRNRRPAGGARAAGLDHPRLRRTGAGDAPEIQAGGLASGRAVHHARKGALPKRPGVVAVLCAGTSDLPVAEEAAVTADIMGNQVERVYDVGVAGLHRLLGRLEAMQRAHVLIVVAGMEGALPSVVADWSASPSSRCRRAWGMGQFWRVGGFARHAQQLQQRRHGGEY